MLDVSYPPEKRAFLAEAPTDYLRDLALDIPVSKLQSVLDQLPPVKGGFRPGKDRSVRLSTYFARMNRWSQGDWQLFGRIWLLWTQSHPAIEQVLAITSEERLDLLVTALIEVPEKRREVIMTMILGARGKGLTQEKIRAWYDLGPFPPDPEVTMLCGLAPTAADAAVPDRMSAVEHKVSHIESVYQDLASELKVLSGEARGLMKLPGAITETQNKLRSTEDAMRQVVTRIQEVEEAIGRLIKDLDRQGTGLKLIRSEIGGVQSQVVAVARDVDHCREAIESSTTRQGALSELVMSLSVQLEEVQAATRQFAMDLEERLTQLTIVAATRATTPNEQPELGPQLPVREIRISDPILLENMETVRSHLAKNLYGLGVKLPQAQKLAVEVLSALLTGQLVTFAGSLGSMVAERCAVSLAGAATKVASIPVGLLDGRPLDKFLESCLSESEMGSSPVAIVLQGVNRSAFEAYGDGLRRFVSERILALPDRDYGVMLFASALDGPSTIPYGKCLAELGPVFDTDALGWLDKTLLPPTPGTIYRNALLEALALPDIKLDWEETWLPDWLLRSAGVLWRRALLRATSHYMALGLGSALEHGPIPSDLAFGWVLPMILQFRPDEAGGIVESLDLDGRATALLSLYGVDMPDA